MSHYYGDGWPHWEDLHNAINYIETYWRKWGRIDTCMCKEKYGTFRDHSAFWAGSLRGVLSANHYYLPYDKGIWTMLDYKIVRKITYYTGIMHLFHKWQAFIYNRGVQLACLKWPHITDELLSDLIRYDLIKKGPGTPAGGEELHDKYWTRLSSKSK
jgi:hypothetical protein